MGNASGGPDVNEGQPVQAGQLPHQTSVADRITLSDEVKDGRQGFKTGTTANPQTYGRNGRLIG